MNASKSILFPTDFSAESLNALVFAIDYAKKSDSTITLINVIEYPWKVLDIISNSITKNIFDRTEVELATRSMLQKISNGIKNKYGIEVNYKICYGSLINTLLDYIGKTSADLIVLATKESDNSILSKSKSYKIADYSTISAITISDKTKFKTVKRILFPISDKIHTTKKLNEIARVSKIYDAEVVLLGISSKNNVSLDGMSFYMESLLKTLENKKIRTQIKMVIGKDYAEEINKFSIKNQIDLIGIISNYEHGPLSLFRCTPDEKLIKQSKIPILSIPLETPAMPNHPYQSEYISPWSMKYDINNVNIPLKN